MTSSVQQYFDNITVINCVKNMLINPAVSIRDDLQITSKVSTSNLFCFRSSDRFIFP